MVRRQRHSKRQRSQALTVATVANLRALVPRCGEGLLARKEALLAACSQRRLRDPRVIVAYHDCLLFLLVYPESATLHRGATRELQRVAAATAALPARDRALLADSGMAGTQLTIAFGHDIARWLVKRYPQQADIDSFAAEGASLAATARHALLPLEFELVDSAAVSSESFLDEAREGFAGTRLQWLVQLFSRLPVSATWREDAFDALRVFIRLDFGSTTLARGLVRGPTAPTWFSRRPLLRRIDLPALLATPLDRPAPLSTAQRRTLLDAGRAMLASMGRETDAIAAADERGVEYHPLGRGLAIALYAMAPGRRLPLDSHVGFMLFRNAVPVAYGGGWPFLGTCKIGVNIFAPFRGGESAWLFGQVLRAYAQRFGIDRFIAEPSQFGAGNREGLASGAFWFYYRLGFRPRLDRVAALAQEEFARLAMNPAERTPLSLLRRFTASELTLELADSPAVCDTADLSLAVSARIASHYGGNRDAAERDSLRHMMRALGLRSMRDWPEEEARAFRLLCPLIAMIPAVAGWPAPDRRALLALMRAKGGNEFRFFDGLRRHRRLAAALHALVA